MSDFQYKVVYQGGVGEYEEKKSRFIATVQPVNSEEEAASFINSIKKQYWDARHNCSAFTIGNNHELTRCTDDGEPAGTAGRPMLDVLLREDIHNVAVVVTRYFGGTLLGTGGLVRAYQKSTQAGLENSIIIIKQQGILLDIRTDYTGFGKVQYQLAQYEIPVADTEYTDQVLIHAVVPKEQKQRLVAAITEGTNGTAGLEWGDEVTYALIEGKLQIM